MTSMQAGGPAGGFEAGDANAMPEPRALMAPTKSPGLRLWQVSLAWQRQIAAALKPFNLTQVQFILLTSTWWLNDMLGEQPSQRRIAEVAGTGVVMTSQVLRALEGKGYIERREDPNDARGKLVSATDAGIAQAQKALQDVLAVDDRFFEPVNEEDFTAMLMALGRFDDDMTSLEAHPRENG